MSYVYVAITILSTVYGQLVIKWQVSQVGALPESSGDKLIFLLKLCLNPWVMSGLFAAFVASLAWMAALTRLPLNHAYPFVSITFILVPFAAALLFHEPLSWPKLVGMLCIVAGVAVGSQG